MSTSQIAPSSDLQTQHFYALSVQKLLAEAKRNKARVERGEATTISHQELKRIILEKSG